MSTRFDFVSQPQSISSHFEDLGMCYDSPFKRLTKNILEGTPIQDHAVHQDDEADLYTYEYISTMKDFKLNSNLSASAKASYGLAKASAKASLQRFYSYNSFSCYILGFIRIVEPRFVFDFTKCKVESKSLEFIQNSQKKLDVIEREYGDEVVSSVTIGREIVIRAEIATSSEAEKEEIKTSLGVSYGKISGNMKFSQMISKLKEGKSVNIEIHGTMSNAALPVSPEEADNYISTFPTTPGKFRIRQTNMRDIKHIPELIGLELYNLNDLIERRAFIDRLDFMYEFYHSWLNDINYVLSKDNATQFTSEMIAKAESHAELCSTAQQQLMNLYGECLTHWKNTGRNDNFFKLDRIPKQLAFFYPRVAKAEPAPVQPQQEQTPTEPVVREPSRNDHGGGAGGGSQ